MKNKSFIIPIIAIISVAVMIIWGTLANSYQYSWLAVFVGGIAITIFSIIQGAKNDKK